MSDLRPCNAPYTSMYLDPRGEVRVCCQNVWQRLGNIGERSLTSMWRGEEMTRLRRAMDEADLTLGCERCAVHVDEGHPEVAYARAYDRLTPTSSEPQWPQQLELALSNSCNLQCVMCNGELSSAIRIHREQRPPLPEVYGDDFFTELDDFLPHLRSVVFLGGEPFLAKESLRVMHRLVELGLRPHCSITTNGTIWNRRVQEMVSSLSTHIAISLDAATAATFESTRVGADHDQVLTNIHRFRDSVGATGGSVSLAFCLMRNNWNEFLDLLRWADDSELSVYVNSVTHPPTLSLVHAPMDELRGILHGLDSQDRRARTELGLNRSAWDQELDKLRRLIEDRSVEVPVNLSRPQQPVSAPASKGRHAARIDTGPDQLITEVDPGSTALLGLGFDSLVGGPIWNVQPHLCDILGRTGSTELTRFDDGAEEFRIDFSNQSGTVEMVAHLTPDADGAQSWALEFHRTENPPADPGDAGADTFDDDAMSTLEALDSEEPDAVSDTTTDHATTPGAPPDADRRRVLLDPERNAELARDGFTVMPLVDPATVSRLRAIYAVQHGWSGEGFEPDLLNPDSGYRRTVSNELEKLLGETTSALFTRHRPFLRLFLCKWPGEGSDLYIHRDWMYTDERQGVRTYVVWIALQDITAANGPLRVLPGSHRLDPMLRGTNLNPSWLAHQEVLAERLAEVTVRAGEAIVFDNQLIHASPTNRTDQPRLVTAIGMKDRDAPLVYFHRRDEHCANRYDVDEEFFLTNTPVALLEGPPDLEVAETITVTGEDLDGDELATRLDTIGGRRSSALLRRYSVPVVRLWSRLDRVRR